MEVYMSGQHTEGKQEKQDNGDHELPPVITVDEVASLLRVNRNIVYDLFQRGEIPGGRKVGRSIRFSRDTVIKWLQGNLLTSH
jgi:excisionase family DNA binding protein